MATKKQLFIEMELEWAEEQLASWKAYIDTHPFETLKDRVELKPTSKGGVIPMVIASVEQQGKFLQETLKNYLALLKEVNSMRADEAAAKEAKGGSFIPHRMSR